MAAAFAQEAKTLEYWRKRYLGQAVIVGVLAFAPAAAGWICADFFILKVFLTLLAAVFVYIMCQGLQRSLQARGEGLILAKGGEAFGEVMFDVGRGLCENALLAQEIAKGYQVRECDNVMRGKGYWLEEDWFYAVVSTRYIPLNQTVFKGVVLAFADLHSEDGLKGNLLLKNGKAVITGGLAQRLKQSGAAEIAATFVRLFKANGAELVTADKTLYLWIKTEERLFYQFSLFRPNTFTAFQRRIENLKEPAEKMLSALNG